jgi:CheY-like chemotaxis protein
MIMTMARRDPRAVRGGTHFFRMDRNRPMVLASLTGHDGKGKISSGHGREREVLGPGKTMGARVLLVEDEEPIAQMIREVVGGFDVEFHWASDGIQARELLQSLPFDLILTDLIFTRTGGLDLIRWVRERDEAVPIVVMTGFGAAAAQEAMEAGASESILKPFEIHDLRQILSRHLQPPQGGDRRG